LIQNQNQRLLDALQHLVHLLLVLALCTADFRDDPLVFQSARVDI